MKRRILVLLLATILILSCTAGVSGSDIVCFVAINDTIPDSLPGYASPFYDNGILYVPYTAFDGSPNGIFTSYNVEKNTFAMANRGYRLVYDLVNSTVTDESGTVTDVELAYRNGLLFIPGIFTASHFGLNLSLLTSETGCPVIRFTNGSETYSDEEFIKKAEFLISHVLDYYVKEENNPPENADPSKENDDEKEDEEETERGKVYLAFTGDAVCKETLKHLEALEAKGAFFVTKSQIETKGSLIRELYGSGHTIGIAPEPGETDLTTGLTEANEALSQCLFLKTVMALVPGEVSPAGYIAWNESGETATVDQILADPMQPHLLLCRTDVLEQLKKLITMDVEFLQLVETTQLSVA